MIINSLNSLSLNPARPPEKAIVLLSGGLDSATCLGLVKCTFPEVKIHAMFFDYGQTHLEEEKAKSIFLAKEYCVAFHDIRLPELPGSALTDGKPVETVVGGTNIAPTFVPGRNLIFASHAAALAEVIGAEVIVTGINAVDYSGYPDCRPEFVRKMQAVINVSLPSGTEHNRPIHYCAPLLYMTKVEIVKLAMNLHIDLSKTHSCYFPTADGEACHVCASCVIRDKAIAEATEINNT